MFLATTALESFWQPSRKMLFLGEWCKLYQRRQVWSAMDFETLPYHWLDRQKFRRDYEYLARAYEHYLLQLARQLNEIHQVDHSHRYWRLVVGWWLKNFVDLLFDRHESLRLAQEQFAPDATWVLDTMFRERFAPRDFREFDKFFVSDEYSLFLFTRLIELQGVISHKAIAFDFSSFFAPRHAGETGAEGKSLKQGLVSTVKAGRRLAPHSMKDIAFTGGYFQPGCLAKLQLGLGLYPSLEMDLSSVTSPPRKFDRSLRQRLRFSNDGDAFGEMLDVCVAENLPQVYLESYSEMAERVEQAFPETPRVIYTAVSHLSDDVFKLWAAGCTERGSKLAVGQHGGHRGSGMLNSALDHELAIADVYFSWGWQGDSKIAKVRMAPGSKLIGNCQRTSASASQPTEVRAYLNLSSYPRYSINLYSIPLSSVWAKSLQFQLDFVGALRADVRRRLKCRPYMIDYGWSEEERFRDAFPELEMVQGCRSWADCLSVADLVIETNNQTTLLEALAANVPTVLVLQESYWEMTAEARAPLEGLKRAGIYFTDGISASEHINRIVSNPWDWWQQPHVQEAKNEFCNRFAYTREDWLSLWKSEFQSLRRAAGSFKAAA